MGIQGLLPLLKSIQRPCNLKQFAGQTLGVDAYGWLHRGTVACAVELATGKPTSRYIDFCMHRVRMLIHYGVTPYLIFDGDYLPSKKGTEKERSAKRKESKRLGLELLNMGKTAQAYLELQKAVDVTPEMAGALIEELKRANVKYVVAPYEADSQMVFLEKKGIIQGVLSEDSDLLVFGCKNLLTKLDQYGECVLIRRQDFTSCREISFAGWTDEQFRHMAIMSGCDYLKGIDKMGLKTAWRLLRTHKKMERVLQQLRFDAKFKVPAGYAVDFRQAELTFLHQWVYCPEARELVHLTPLDDGLTLDDLPFIGKHVNATTATGVAKGELHPHTKQPLQLPSLPQKRWTGPLHQRNRKPVVADTPDLKKHKSIDSFFKPSRTPLAELDVNLFTGTPQQQAMARRASGASWTGVAAPTPGTAPVQARRAFSDNAAPRRTTSERAPKRQRLCAEDLSPIGNKEPENVKSKFFGDDSATPSRSTRSRKEQFELWSDASLDDALSQLPLSAESDVIASQVTKVQKKRKNKMEVFDDRQGVEAVEKDETQLTNVSTVFSQSHIPEAEEASPSPASEIAAEDESKTEENEPATFDLHMRAELATLKSKFTFTASKPSRIPRSPTTSMSKALRTSHRKSVPQKGNSRLRDSGIGLDNAFEKSDPPEQDEIEDEIVVPDSDAVEPHSPPATTPQKSKANDTGQKMTLSAVGGSEDLLVSESEAEVSETPAPKARGFSMDLGRFAFTAA